MQQPSRSALDHLSQFWIGVTKRVHGDASHPIYICVAGSVIKHDTFATLKDEGRALVRLHKMLIFQLDDRMAGHHHEALPFDAFAAA
jgi:hypothetical protein